MSSLKDKKKGRYTFSLDGSFKLPIFIDQTFSDLFCSLKEDHQDQLATGSHQVCRLRDWLLTRSLRSHRYQFWPATTQLVESVF